MKETLKINLEKRRFGPGQSFDESKGRERGMLGKNRAGAFKV